MKRRLALLLAALVASGAAAASAVAATSRFELTESGGAKFPVRAFVIGLHDNRSLTAGDLHVTENGGDVVDVTLTPASAVGKHSFGVVLVVDASDSMAGEPIRSAMAAARAFNVQRNPNQQLALVTFNGAPKLALPFTTSKSRIAAALAQVPQISYGTHIFDAVAMAERLLVQAKIDSGSVVVLSDGADTGSTATSAAVTQRATLNHVKLFSIGLHSKKFDAKSLQSLATAGGGEYTEAASTTVLSPLFDKLGARLANEYVLRYKSLAGPDIPVKVDVSVAGAGTSSAAYRAPALKLAAPPPYRASLRSRVWGSRVTIVVLAVLAGIAVFFGAVGFLAPTRSGLPARMAEFVSVPGLQTRGGRPGGPATVAAASAETPAHLGWSGRLDEALEIAQIDMTAPALVALMIGSTMIVCLVIFVASQSLWWTALGLLTPLPIREWVVRKLARRRKLFAEQLPDSLQVISSALRSGHSFAGALAVVVESSNEPMKSEMQRVVADEQLGVSLEDSLGVVSRRMDNRDLEQVALVAELQREAGTNSAEVVDRVAETIRERFELRRLVSTLTVQGRMSRWIVSAIPVVIVLLLQLINPHYLHPLVAHTGGKIALGFAIAMVVAGSLVIKKIVDIKV